MVAFTTRTTGTTFIYRDRQGEGAGETRLRMETLRQYNIQTEENGAIGILPSNILFTNDHGGDASIFHP